MKRCSKCGEVKPLDSFYADRRNRDGKQSQCKRCMNDKSASYNRTHREQALAYSRRSKAAAAARSSTAARQRQQRQQRPEQMRAHKLVARAIKRGELVRPDRCDRCRRPCKPVAHHDDYSRPLDVRWLCSQCHSDADAHRPRLHL